MFKSDRERIFRPFRLSAFTASVLTLWACGQTSQSNHRSQVASDDVQSESSGQVVQLADSSTFGSPAVLNLRSGAVCPKGRSCQYKATENTPLQIACSDGAKLAVLKSSYLGAGQAANPFWDCMTYLAPACDGKSGCNVRFNNLNCSGDPDFTHLKVGTLEVACGAGNPAAPDVPPCGVLPSGQDMRVGEELTSCDSGHTLQVQSDGNVVIYSIKSGKSRPTWASDTYGEPIRVMRLSVDGELRLFDNKGTVRWRSRTQAGQGQRTNAGLIMQNDGNLVIYDQDGKALWDSGTYDASPYSNYSQDRVLAKCSNPATGTESCHWSYYYKKNCLKNKCSKLLIYFSGGQMSCPNPLESPKSYLSRYADDGYVAVCARLFEKESTSGLFPFNKEASRVDLLIKTITSDPAITQAWNGQRLLISGVSHGASSAVVAMARNDFDASASHWHGSQVTGACLFDGIYNATDNLLRSSSAQNATPPGKSCTIYPRGYGRYCPWNDEWDAPSKWPLPSACHSPDLALDTVARESADSFAIKNWKLVECGSALYDYCGKDMVPAQSQLQLFNNLKADASHNSSFESFPYDTHDNCGATTKTMDSCKDWFNKLR